MDYNALQSRLIKTNRIVSIPTNFYFNQGIGKFSYNAPEPAEGKKKQKPKFEINTWVGCLPVFQSKVAGTTMDNRPMIFQEIKEKLARIEGSEAHACLKKDEQNPYDKNAIQVLVYIEDPDGNEIMRPKMVGFLPKDVAAWVKYMAYFRVGYKLKFENIRFHSKFPSISLKLTPFVADSKTKTTTHPEEVIASPTVKNVVGGSTIEDFRQALEKKARRK